MTDKQSEKLRKWESTHFQLQLILTAPAGYSKNHSYSTYVTSINLVIYH